MTPNKMKNNYLMLGKEGTFFLTKQIIFIEFRISYIILYRGFELIQCQSKLRKLQKDKIHIKKASCTTAKGQSVLRPKPLNF